MSRPRSETRWDSAPCGGYITCGPATSLHHSPEKAGHALKERLRGPHWWRIIRRCHTARSLSIDDDDFIATKSFYLGLLLLLPILPCRGQRWWAHVCLTHQPITQPKELFSEIQKPAPARTFRKSKIASAVPGLRRLRSDDSPNWPFSPTCYYSEMFIYDDPTPPTCGSTASPRV